MEQINAGGELGPLTDARGVSFDKAHAEIGAYAYELSLIHI